MAIFLVNHVPAFPGWVETTFWTILPKERSHAGSTCEELHVWGKFLRASKERTRYIRKTKQICENKNQKASAELDFNHLLTDKTHLTGS